MTAPAGRWISVKECAAYLGGLRAPAVYRMIYQRTIPAARIGRTWLVDLPALEEILGRQSKKVKP